MKKNILQEYFNFASGTHTSKEGNKNKIIYIDPKTSEEYMPYAKDLKYKFGATWIGAIKAYGWWMNKNQEATLEKIRKCMTYLFGVEKNPDNVLREVDAEVVKLLDGLDTEILKKSNSTEIEISDELLEKVENFKLDIINKLNSPKTQKFIVNLQKFRYELKKHSGQYPPSMSNALLIMFTKPDATEVRPKDQWIAMNYQINDDATPIPQVGMNRKYKRYSKEEEAKIIADYCREHNASNMDELEKSARWDLTHRRLKGRPIWGTEWFFNYAVYDISDVTPLEGAERPPEEPDEDWWWSKAPEDEKDRKLCDALMAFAQTLEGGSITFVTNKSKGRERGWSSMNGTINTQADGYIRFPTMVHELTHSLRHWAFSSQKNPQLKRFYNGNSTEMQEQEADLVAAFVSASFGYDNTSNVNYVKNWGLTDDNVSKVFDELAALADYIEKGVRKYLQDNQLNESIKRVVKRQLNEIARYDDTIEKADDTFNQETFMGKLRSKMFPKKYQQYQRVRQKATELGQEGADNINAERERIPIDSFGGFGVYDFEAPDFAKYAYELTGDYNDGEDLYKERIKKDKQRTDKYGRGGRIMKPIGGYETNQYKRTEDAYKKQQEKIKSNKKK